MTNICHLFDEAAGWQERIGATHLIERLASDRYRQVIALPGRVAAHLALPSCDVRRLPSLPWPALLGGPLFARLFRSLSVDVIHAWGIRAAVTARAASDAPMVVHRFDPVVSAREMKCLRTLASTGRFAVICSAEIVRRRLIEGGLDPAMAVTVRPGVDFGLARRVRRSDMRESLGIAADAHVILLPEPVTKSGGDLDAFWAASLHGYLTGGVKVIVPGPSCEQERIGRLAATVPGESMLVATDARHPFEHLVAIADVLLVAPAGDVPTTSIAWAMASHTAVIGSAVYAVAELIANKVNGLLFKRTAGRSVVPALVQRLSDRATQSRMKEVARGQAYEVFSLRRYAEQCAQVYENLRTGRAPADGVVDSAVVA